MPKGLSSMLCLQGSAKNKWHRARLLGVRWNTIVLGMQILFLIANGGTLTVGTCG